MMRCSEVKELIQLYMDNELESRSTLEVRLHLDGCPSCSHLLESFLQQDRMLREQALSETVSSAALREEVHKAIQPRPEFSLRAFGVVSWVRMAAAVVVTVAVAFVLVREGWIPGLEDSVYAAAVMDHDAHCGLDKAPHGVSDVASLTRLAEVHAHLGRIPDLSSFGYRSSHGTICRIKDLEFLHLVYYDDGGQPLSLFVRGHSPGLLAAGLAQRSDRDYNIASVTGSGVDILLVTSSVESRSRPLIQSVLSQI